MLPRYGLYSTYTTIFGPKWIIWRFLENILKKSRNWRQVNEVKGYEALLVLDALEIQDSPREINGNLIASKKPETEEVATGLGQNHIGVSLPAEGEGFKRNSEAFGWREFADVEFWNGRAHRRCKRI